MYATSDFLLYNNLFIYQVLCTLIYRRRSLYSFVLHVSIVRAGLYKLCKASRDPIQYIFLRAWKKTIHLDISFYQDILYFGGVTTLQSSQLIADWDEGWTDITTHIIFGCDYSMGS